MYFTWSRGSATLKLDSYNKVFNISFSDNLEISCKALKTEFSAMKVKELIQWGFANFLNQTQYDHYRPKLKKQQWSSGNYWRYLRQHATTTISRVAIFPREWVRVFCPHSTDQEVRSPPVTCFITPRALTPVSLSHDKLMYLLLLRCWTVYLAIATIPD